MNPAPAPSVRGWHYAEVGDYHRELDPNWSYTPTYLRKISLVKRFIAALPTEASILDAGCGEGVLVEQLHRAGRRIHGVDLNYQSEFVSHGSVLALPHAADSFDVVLLLDVLEHLAYADQPRALRELLRVLKPGGHFILAIPNLAHWNSRHRFFFHGRLDRSDTEFNHVGERPMWENLCLIQQAGCGIEHITGITLTVPWLYREVICRQAARYRWLHDVLEPVAARYPAFALLNLFFCRKPPLTAPAVV